MTAATSIMELLDGQSRPFSIGYGKLAERINCSRRQAIRAMQSLVRAREVHIIDYSDDAMNTYESKEMAITLTIDALLAELENCEGVTERITKDAIPLGHNGGETYRLITSDYPGWYRDLCKRRGTCLSKVFAAMNSDRPNKIKEELRELAISILSGEGPSDSQLGGWYRANPHPLFDNGTVGANDCPF